MAKIMQYVDLIPTMDPLRYETPIPYQTCVLVINGVHTLRGFVSDTDSSIVLNTEPNEDDTLRAKIKPY